ncbi:hypothetical protein V8B97DRAFT_2020960 [Scleroderma yunnanense]
MDSDEEAAYGVGRRVASSPKRSFTPTSDDGESLVIPVTNAGDTSTPSPENTPIIRKPLGFSWIPSNSTHIETYEATLPPKSATAVFLPGQAPPPPPKPPRQQKPKTTRKKKNQEYSSQTGRFRLMASPALTPADFLTLTPSVGSSLGGVTPFHSPATITGSSPGTLSSGSSIVAISPPNMTTQLPLNSSMMATANSPMSETRGYRNPTLPSQVNAEELPAASRKRTKRDNRVIEDTTPDIQSPRSVHHQRPQAITTEGLVPQVSYNRRGSDNQGEPVENIGSTTPHSNNTNAQRPLRMLTLLIEDMRSGVPDSQLAEIKVPLKVAEDPQDGFWADAVDVCNALQASPSRIDGPAKVFTMRAKFRQFFMRVDIHDNHHVTPAHLGVSKQRTLDVFVEAPLPQGQLPRYPGYASDVWQGHRSDSDSEPSTSCPNIRPQIRVRTRDEQIEALSKVNFATSKGRSSPASDVGPHKRKRIKLHGQGSTRAVTPPPIPAQLAETEEERDEAIIKWIKPKVDDHPDFLKYMQSKAKPQRVSEVLKQYNLVSNMLQQLSGLKTPIDCDGAPNCMVKMDHVLRALDLDSDWEQRCREILLLVTYYGNNGTRYEDSRVIDMINDTAVPKPNVMDKFLRLLKTVDRTFAEETLQQAASSCDSDE